MARKAVEPKALWDRQPGETAKQYERFCQYRDMRYIAEDKTPLDGIQRPYRSRSMRGLARELNCRFTVLGEMSRKNNWIERVEAYDMDIERQNREEREQAILRMNKNHADLAAQMVKKAAKRLLTIPEKELSAADIVRLIDSGVKIERLSRGEPTENRQIAGETKVTHSGSVEVKATREIDFSDLSNEELVQLEGLLDKLHTESTV